MDRQLKAAHLEVIMKRFLIFISFSSFATSYFFIFFYFDLLSLLIFLPVYFKTNYFIVSAMKSHEKYFADIFIINIYD